MNPPRRRPVAGLLAAALLGATLVTVAAPASAAPVPPKIWERRLDGARIAESSPLLVDLDGSGGLDIVVGAYDQKVYAVRGSDASNLPGWPQTTSHRINSSAAAADVNGDGSVEVFIGSGMGEDRAGGLYSYTAGGTQRFRSAPGDAPHFPSGAPVHATPAIGDLDGDGDYDATVGSQGVRSLWTYETGNGGPRSLFYWDDSMFSSGALHDVNGDGVPEYIVGGDSTAGAPIDHRGGMVRAFNGGGGQHWEFLTNDIVRSSPAVGDIDGDGRPEVVFGVGDFYGGSDARYVFAVDAANGREKWRRQVDGVTNSSPALADINGDGTLDVAIGTFNSARLDVDGGSVYALNGSNGSDLAGFPKSSGGGVVLGGIVTADVDGDGGQDLFVPTGAYIAVFSGKTGAKLFNLAEGASVAFQNSPAIGDVDGDGLVDVVAAGTSTGGHGYLYRWELPAPAKLGSLGWHQFHKDTFRSGSWTHGVPVFDPVYPSRRIEGGTRFETAVALSAGAPTGGTVYVATGRSFGDALAGGPAAASDDAPVLLVERDSVPSTTLARINALRPQRIVVLGGAGAVSASVFDELDDLATQGADRIEGGDRWETAAEISKQSFSPGVPVAYVATGATAFDALAGATAAARRGGPVLLVQRDAIPSSTATELGRLRPQSIVVLGASGVVSDNVESQLRAYGSVTRNGGGDRYASAVAVSRASYPFGADTAYLATGLDYPDALAGGPVAAADGAPMLLVSTRCMPASVRQELVRLGVTNVVLLGSAGVLSSAVTSLEPCP